MNSSLANPLSTESSWKAIPQRFYPYAVYLYSLLLPLPNHLKNIGLFLLLGLYVLNVIRQKKISLPSLYFSPYALLLLYLVVCAGSILVSDNKKYAADYLVLQLTVPILPLLLYRKLTYSERNRALQVFSFSTFCLSVYALVDIFRIYLTQLPQPLVSWNEIDWVLISYQMPRNINFHAPYYSLYIGICLLIHITFLHQNFLRKNYKNLLLHAGACLFFLSFQALLSSRTALFATLLVITLGAGYQAIQTNRWKLLLAVLVVVASSGYVIYERIPYLKMKMSQSAGHEERRLMWQASVHLLQEHPLYGVGSGDRKEAITQVYRKIGFTEGLNGYYNSHNQFLEWGVSFGWIGILTLTTVFVALLGWSLQRKQYLLLGFLAVFILCCITESLLQRQAGVLLFSYMVSLLGFAPKEEVKQKDSLSHSF